MRTIMWFGFVLGALSAAGEVILSTPGNNTKLKCGINTNFKSVEWLKENNRIILMGDTGIARKGSGEIVQRSRVTGADLQVSRVKEEDAGKFTCKMDGKSKVHTLLVVLVSADHSGALQQGGEATLKCQVKGLDSTVKWRWPNGTETQSGIVQLKPVAHSHKGKWECLFNHDSVPYSEILNIIVEAAPVPTKVSTEVYSPTCISCVSNPPPKDSSLVLELSWWVWVAIGAGSLVMVLLMVFVVVLCKRIRRKKRKHRMRQNGHQPLNPRQFCQCNRPTAAAAKPQQGRRREKPLALPRQPLLME
ncbi:CD4-2 molecule, tandem duplicate 2 [Notolabrus celidotus]|uniref:CD4-2 molecule, tandem duplicate 2 n=1 Tax=Notolabrus celidotus TaxID=1203425 RepID=UPI00148FF88F|nr:CD4-2 molecule, tandem duplicate 2 [Notolabrus celidotus]